MKSINEQNVINPETTSAKRRVDACLERCLKENAYYCEGFSSEQMKIVTRLITQANIDGFLEGLWWTPGTEEA